MTFFGAHDSYFHVEQKKGEKEVKSKRWARIFFGVFHRWGWRVAGSNPAEAGSGSSSCQPNGHFSNRHLVGPTNLFLTGC